MNMLKKIKFSLFLIILVLFFFRMQNFCSTALISDYYSFSFDSILAKDLAASVNKYANLNLKNKKPQELFTALKNEFSVISSISMLKNDFNSVKVKVEVEIPSYKINNNLVLTNNNQFLPVDCFNQATIDSLESITVQFDEINQLNNIDQEFVQFVSSLSKDLLLNFDIDYHQKNEIFLTSKEDKKFLILTRYNKVPSLTILNQCKNIKNEKNIQYNKKFIADLRFDDQITVSIS